MTSFIFARVIRAIVVLVFTVTIVFVILRLSGDRAKKAAKCGWITMCLSAANARRPR